MHEASQIAESFRAKFGGRPRVYRAPGRVNLIGEHTDYNDGFVMPAAIGLYCWAAIGPREDRKMVISSQEFPGDFECDLDTAIRRSGNWSDYAAGVAFAMERAGLRLRGANLLLHGEVPIGAGLSSSAALEVATALALAEESGAHLDRPDLARICQRAENEFVGMNCGIMDQFISLHGHAKEALMIDCRSLAFESVPLADSAHLVVCHTGVKHKLAAGQYNRRRSECEEAVRELQRMWPEIRELRDVSTEQLERCRGVLSATVFKRARHVVSENARVLEALAAMRRGDVRRFGAEMNASHASLRDDYEVSCAELDLMVEIARQQQGVYGARMTGGGFGGATINLIERDACERFTEKVGTEYRRRTGIAADIRVLAPVDGAARVESSELAG